MQSEQWTRASRCDSGHCVEVMKDPYWVSVRSSFNTRTDIKFTPEEWITFIEAAKAGEFDV